MSTLTLEILMVRATCPTCEYPFSGRTPEAVEAAVRDHVEHLHPALKTWKTQIVTEAA